jgi:C4-dicarboxylate-specific signal transduction histidine kinase
VEQAASAAEARQLIGRRRLDALRLHADRLATLGTMAAGVAHELNSPLAAVLSNLDDLEAELARLVASDNGPGVPPELVPQLFTPFFTTKPHGEGTGLGLSVVADIVRAAGGRIDYEPTPGGGATFRVLLPPAPATGASKDAAS